MKLAVASLALASVALLEGATAASSKAGQCIAAASTYAAAAGENGENGYDNNGNAWNEEASYYADANEAESYINENMMALAEALGLDVEAYQYEEGQEGQEGQEGGQNQYSQNQDLASQGYMVFYDEDLAQALGLDQGDEDNVQATFASFYELTYKLVQQGGCYADGQNQYNQYCAQYCAQNNEQE